LIFILVLLNAQSSEVIFTDRQIWRRVDQWMTQTFLI